MFVGMRFLPRKIEECAILQDNSYLCRYFMGNDFMMIHFLYWAQEILEIWPFRLRHCILGLQDGS